MFLRFIDYHLQLFMIVANHRYRSSLFQTITQLLKNLGLRKFLSRLDHRREISPRTELSHNVDVTVVPVEVNLVTHSQVWGNSSLVNDIDFSKHTETDLIS